MNIIRAAVIIYKGSTEITVIPGNTGITAFLWGEVYYTCNCWLTAVQPAAHMRERTTVLEQYTIGTDYT
jgi:hypothetical protein